LNIFGQSRISPDGKSILVFGAEKKRYEENNYEGGIYIVDVKTSMVNEIKVKQEIGSGSCIYEWDKEGKNIFYTAKNQIIIHNIESGEEKILYNEKPFSSPNIIRSYDGNNLIADIMVDNNTAECQLLSIPLNGGDAKLMFTHKDVSAIRFKRMALSPDGKYVYFTSLAKGFRSVLYRIPESGGTPEKLWQSKNCFLPGLSIHPGGNKIALSTYQPGGELRLIENLDNEVAKIFTKEE
jgi:Tol biopolymer transport system component